MIFSVEEVRFRSSWFGKDDLRGFDGKLSVTLGELVVAKFLTINKSAWKLVVKSVIVLTLILTLKLLVLIRIRTFTFLFHMTRSYLISHLILHTQ